MSNHETVRLRMLVGRFYVCLKGADQPGLGAGSQGPSSYRTFIQNYTFGGAEAFFRPVTGVATQIMTKPLRS